MHDKIAFCNEKSLKSKFTYSVIPLFCIKQNLGLGSIAILVLNNLLISKELPDTVKTVVLLISISLKFS